MVKNLQIFLIILLLPTFAEAIDAKSFNIIIPGSPLSLGRITLIFVGFIALVYNKTFKYKSKLLLGLIFIFFGGIIGGFLSNDVLNNLSSSIGNIFLFFGAVGLANLWEKNSFKSCLNIYFITCYLYWVIYIITTTAIGEIIVSYSDLNLNKEVINHHVSGMIISVSSTYLAVNYFYKDRKLQLFGFIVFFFGILACFLSESRSNFIITVLAMLLLVSFSKIKFKYLILILIPVAVLSYSILINLSSKNETLYQRFNAADHDYQERTTGMRIGYFKTAVEEILANPLGKGILNVKIEFEGRNRLTHNQYMSFILAGGLFAFVGLLFWLGGFLKILIRALKRNKSNSFKLNELPLIMTSFVFLVTLLTVENGGPWFFIMLSHQIYLSEKAYNLLKFKKTNKKLIFENN